MLERITRVRPDLWETILVHPNCFKELTDWIMRQPVLHSRQSPVTEHVEESPGAAKWQKVAGAALAICAAIGLISVIALLPAPGVRA